MVAAALEQTTALQRAEDHWRDNNPEKKFYASLKKTMRH
jgi:hypothetical protein